MEYRDGRGKTKSPVRVTRSDVTLLQVHHFQRRLSGWDLRPSSLVLSFERKGRLRSLFRSLDEVTGGSPPVYGRLSLTIPTRPR